MVRPIEQRHNDLVVQQSEVWTPNAGGQEEFMNDFTHRYIALAGGWYAGKTWAGARKLSELHIMNAFDFRGHPTYVKSAIIAPTYQNAEDYDIPEMKSALDQMGLSWQFNGAKEKYHFVLPDLGTKREPSLIIVRTADRPEKITGWTVGAIWGDEAARWKTNDEDPLQDPFIQANARLRDTRARVRQFILTFTHEGDATRMYADFEDPETKKPDHVLYRAGTFENPFAKQFGDDMKLQLTDALADQYLAGNAISLRGTKCYSSYNDANNRDGGIELTNSLPLQLTMDFNIMPGMHGILGQYNKTIDLFTATHEFHGPRMDVRDLLTEFIKWINNTGGWRWPKLEVYGDATGINEWAGNSTSCWDVVRKILDESEIPYTMKYPSSNPYIADRVNAVNCALEDTTGEVHYKIHPRCKRLIEDYKQMKWDENGEMDKTKRKRSHASDAEGYRIHRQRPIRKLSQTAIAMPQFAM